MRLPRLSQVNTAPECIAPGFKIAKTVHNFSAALTLANMASLANRRREVDSFLAEVAARAPSVSGYVTPSLPPYSRFLGAQFVVPHPPGCLPGRTIPGCPAPPRLASGQSIGLVEAYQVCVASLLRWR